MEGQVGGCLLLISLGMDPAMKSHGLPLKNESLSAFDFFRRAARVGAALTGVIDEEEIDEKVAVLSDARNSFLQNERDSNWAKNKSLMLAVVGRSGFLPMQEQKQAMNKAEKLAAAPRHGIRTKKRGHPLAAEASFWK